MDLASIISHIHNWVLFLLWIYPFILSGVIFPLISSSILGSDQPGEFIFHCPIVLPFHTVHWVLKARILKWLPFPSPVDHVLSELSTMTCPSWWPYMAWLSFIELYKAVVHMIRLASCLWLWFQSICPLMPSLCAYCLTGVSLTLDVVAPAKCSWCSSPWIWVFSSWPQLLTLDVVSSLNRRSWPWMQGISSLPLTTPVWCSHSSPIRLWY